MQWVLDQLDLATLDMGAIDATDGVQGCAAGLAPVPARSYIWGQMWLAAWFERVPARGDVWALFG